MGAYDLRLLEETSAIDLVDSASLTWQVGAEASIGTPSAIHPARLETDRIARFVGFAWIAALLLIINACFEEGAALAAIPRGYFTADTMISVACRAAAVSAIVTIFLAWLTATARNKLASMALVIWTIVSGSAVASHGWDVADALRWISLGLCTLAAIAAALSVRGAFARRAPDLFVADRRAVPAFG